MQPSHLAGLALGLVLAQALAWGLARCLGLRLPWKVRAAGLGLPFVALLPLLLAGRLLAPTDAPILANLPDAPGVADPDVAHGVFNDAILQLLPWEAEVRRAFREGHPPFWSDLLDGGSSPWINPQTAVLSPIAMLGRLVPLEHFLLATLAVKILLAFEGCWLLARLAGTRRPSAALAAAGFALGGPLLAWSVFPLGSVVAWSPWLALATVRVLRRPAPRRIAALALVTAALLLGGHPEIAAAEFLVAAGFGAILWRRHRLLLPMAGTALGLGLGASLAACALVPFLFAAPNSLRAASSGSPATVLHPLPWLAPDAARLFLSPLNPWSFGRPFHEPFSGPGNWPIAAGGYLGLVVLAGAALALASPRRKLAWALLALAFGMFLLTAGFLPFHWLVSLVPLGRAAALDRYLPAAALPLAVLAALGLDEVWAWRRPGAPARLSRRLTGWLLAGAACAASLTIHHDSPIVLEWLLIAGACGAAGVVGGDEVAGAEENAGVASRRPAGRLVGFGLLAVAALFDLGSWDRDALPRGHRELFYPRTPLIAAIQNAAGGAQAEPETAIPSPPAIPSEPPGPWRAVASGFGIYPSLLPVYGVADLRIDNPLAPAEQLRPLGEIFGFRPEGRRYKSAFNHVEHPFLDFLNVRVVVMPAVAPSTPAPGALSPASTPVPARFELLRGDLALRIFHNPTALPRWFLPTGVEVRDRRDTLAALRDLRDARRVILEREEVGDWRPAERRWDPTAVRLLRSRRGAIELLLPAAGDKLLATSLPFPAGWAAIAASGAARSLRTVRVNTAYLGVLVPAGVTRVDLSFVPPGFRWGAVLSLLGGVAIVLLLVMPRRSWPTSRAASASHCA